MIAIYLFLIMLLPLAIGLLVGYRSIPEGRECPLCPAETLRLRARWLSGPSRILRSDLHLRWCTGCGWEGVTRVRRGAVPVTGATGARKQAREARTPSGMPERRRDGSRRPREAVDLRNIDVAGQPWRVLLQCWHEGGRWYGRLMFNSPSGRIWTDGSRRFDGESLQELLQQALAMSDRALAARLREVVSD